ncbi:hypothetical protein DC438_07135 [Cronobacter sakazakii]|nr:hypothetical protein DC438_07135 [Cronobacter sakazakii]PUY27662.1 hypothetical protein BS421_14420 [Cronobacter sakazakii]
MRHFFPGQEISVRSNFHFFSCRLDKPSRPYVMRTYLISRFCNRKLTPKSRLVLKRIRTRILTI